MTQYSISRQVLGFAGWLLISFAAAGIGAIASINADDFYRQLVRPEWAPPAWLFSPVWTTLYILMGVAAWLVWRRHGFRGAWTALIVFVVQLAVNALWSWLFFVWRQGALAFVEALLLWALIACTIVAFWRLHRLAAALLLPYLAWVGFACVITFATWRLNPGVLG
jgi:translocator protein